MLHVYDPKALHSILVKDNDSFYRGRIINRFLGLSALVSTISY